MPTFIQVSPSEITLLCVAPCSYLRLGNQSHIDLIIMLAVGAFMQAIHPILSADVLSNLSLCLIIRKSANLWPKKHI